MNRTKATALLGLTVLSLNAVEHKKNAIPPVPPTRAPISVYETLAQSNLSGVGVRADVLYMIYDIPGLTYASEQHTFSQTVHSHILNVPGQLSLGCNVALNYTLPRSPSYSFESSWYYISAKFARQDHSNYLVPAHSAVLLTAADGIGTANARMTLNFFDLVMKKSVEFGDWMDLTPGVGLVGGYMNGTSNAAFYATSGNFSSNTAPSVGSTVANLSYVNKFEGIGLKLGFNTAFKIWEGFKLFGDVFYNALYGFAKASLSYSENGLSSGLPNGAANAALGSYDQHQMRTFFDSLLGVAWERSFSDNDYYLNLHAGWRFQTFDKGWKEFDAEFNDSVRELALAGQGLQAGATFKF